MLSYNTIRQVWRVGRKYCRKDGGKNLNKPIVCVLSWSSGLGYTPNNYLGKFDNHEWNLNIVFTDVSFTNIFSVLQLQGNQRIVYERQGNKKQNLPERQKQPECMNAFWF